MKLIIDKWCGSRLSRGAGTPVVDITFPPTTLEVRIVPPHPPRNLNPIRRRNSLGVQRILWNREDAYDNKETEGEVTQVKSYSEHLHILQQQLRKNPDGNSESERLGERQEEWGEDGNDSSTTLIVSDDD